MMRAFCVGVFLNHSSHPLSLLFSSISISILCPDLVNCKQIRDYIYSIQKKMVFFRSQWNDNSGRIVHKHATHIGCFQRRMLRPIRFGRSMLMPKTRQKNRFPFASKQCMVRFFSSPVHLAHSHMLFFSLYLSIRFLFATRFCFDSCCFVCVSTRRHFLARNFLGHKKTT